MSQTAGDFFHGFADTFDTFYDGKRSHFMRWVDQRFRSDMFLRFAWTFEHLGDLKGKRGLDIGCGSGPYIAEALRRGAEHVTALDPAPRMLELTQQRVEKLGLLDRLTLVEGYFPQAKPSGEFDFAVVMGVMDYVDDKLAFIKGLRSLGNVTAAVSFPSRHWLRSPIRKVRYNLRKCPLWFYTESQIRELGTQAGFGTVEVRKIPGGGDGLSRMSATMSYGPPVISIDVEDWPQSSWDRSLPIRPRAADNTRHLLEVLARAKVRTTMFVLGKFAEAFPEVVREIHAAGHEIGSHGYGHVEIFTQSPAVFREDVRRSKDHLEQLLGIAVRGYRAPDFSIIESSLWALETLVDLGFEYDSSIYPVKNSRYGIPTWPLDPRRVVLPDGRGIVELPPAAWVFAGYHWRVAGGGTHRLLPGAISRFLAGRVLKGSPFVYYCHPYEFDPSDFQQMEIAVPWSKRLHQGLGRRQFERRFVAFVGKFGGRPFSELVSQQAWPEYRLTPGR